MVIPADHALFATHDQTTADPTTPDHTPRPPGAATTTGHTDQDHRLRSRHVAVPHPRTATTITGPNINRSPNRHLAHKLYRTIHTATPGQTHPQIAASGTNRDPDYTFGPERRSRRQCSAGP